MKVKRIVRALMALCLIFGMAAALRGVLSVQATEPDLVVKGGMYTVTKSDLSKELEVTFTFKADETKFDGFMGGGYVLQYDPNRMEVDSASVRQAGMIQANDNIASFTVNGQPAQKGMMWLVSGTGVPSQDFDLTMKVKKLFKDGSREPLKINVLAVAEDDFIVSEKGTNGANMITVTNTTSIIPATIKIEDLSLKINGAAKIKTGTKNTYTATVKNALVDTGINWSIEGAEDVGTVINANGQVSVATGETAATIDVIAVAKEDVTKRVTKKVIITKGTFDPSDPSNPNDPSDPGNSMSPNQPSTSSDSNGMQGDNETSSTKKNNIISTGDLELLEVYVTTVLISIAGGVFFVRKIKK